MIFKTAESPAEFEQIHRLNYRTFAEEVGQYTPNGSGILVDRFHEKNTYHIALQGESLLGMVATHDRPPFSVAARLADPSVLDALGGPLLEVRLLAMNPDYRNRLVLPGLLWELYCDARARRYSHLIISGITERLSMYERVGFRALGPATQSGAAKYVPMALSLADPPEHLEWFTRSYTARRSRSTEPLVSLMPGPVEIAPEVRAAFQRAPISHRCAEFTAVYESVRASLSRLAGGMPVAILTGSGTTANDAVALHLHAAFGEAPGLILVNGEFGERLARQATRAGLRYETLSWPWGDPWNMRDVADKLAQRPAWVWAVHLETSTGVLNPLQQLAEIMASREIPLAADCVSSLGATPLPQQGLWMCTGVSGKAIGAYAGLSFVFANPAALERVPDMSLPASMDVRVAIAHRGPQFTVASPSLYALEAALSQCDFARHAEMGSIVRRRLRELGIRPLAAEIDAAPCVTTFVAPDSAFVDRCRRAGFELGGGSGYLRERGWTQIATMGAITSTHP